MEQEPTPTTTAIPLFDMMLGLALLLMPSSLPTGKDGRNQRELLTHYYLKNPQFCFGGGESPSLARMRSSA
jgi:hypothetical protein